MFPSLGRSTKDRSSGAPSDEASAIVSRPKHKPTARSRSTTRKRYRKKDGKRPFKGKVKMLESSNEMSGSESDDSTDSGDTASLAVNFGSLAVTPPPSPPESLDGLECLRARTPEEAGSLTSCP